MLLKKAGRVALSALVFVLVYASTNWAQVYLSTGSTPPFIDSSVLIFGSADSTKGARFEADTNITTGTTRVYTLPDTNGTLVVDNGNFTPPTGILTIGREYVSGFTPSCSSTNVTSAAVVTGSTDLQGSCELVGNGAGSAGAMTLTFSAGSGAYGTSAPFCISGTGSGLTSVGNWGIHAAVSQATFSTTAPTFNWANNNQAGGVVLTTNSRYNIMWRCAAR